jgi:hypothetical protein
MTSFMTNFPPIGEKTAKVLKEVLAQAMDGYTLQAKTKLPDADLVRALEILNDNKLTVTQGDLAPETVRSIYVSVPPGSRGNAQLALQGFLSQKAEAF